MNRIIDIDEDSAVVTCESGVVLDRLNEDMDRHSLVVPLDLGSKGSCQIGGNVSTNAGGMRVLRYGMNLFMNLFIYLFFYLSIYLSIYFIYLPQISISNFYV
jgi:hypothetical protein